MAMVMGAVMAIVMLGFMWPMYANKRLNLSIIVVSIVAYAGALYLVRSQATVDDVSYMEAMIPHHSIAIMTSERAHIRDSRVRKLADGIIEAQVREIAEMKQLIDDLKRNSVQSGSPDLPPAQPHWLRRRCRLARPPGTPSPASNGPAATLRSRVKDSRQQALPLRRGRVAAGLAGSCVDWIVSPANL